MKIICSFKVYFYHYLNNNYLSGLLLLFALILILFTPIVNTKKWLQYPDHFANEVHRLAQWQCPVLVVLLIYCNINIVVLNLSREWERERDKNFLCVLFTCIRLDTESQFVYAHSDQFGACMCCVRQCASLFACSQQLWPKLTRMQLNRWSMCKHCLNLSEPNTNCKPTTTTTSAQYRSQTEWICVWLVVIYVASEQLIMTETRAISTTSHK